MIEVWLVALWMWLEARAARRACKRLERRNPA